jgi:tetratricopeptide (TPR) repeat protein
MLANTVVTVVTVAVLATSAHADDRLAQARQQVKAADIDYRLGRFAEALAEYTKAYELYPVPPLLFNIAQCHKNLKDYAKAIFFYEGYLRDEPTAKNGALVQDLIRESKVELDKLVPDNPHVEPPPPASAAVVATAGLPPAAPAPTEPQAIVATPRDSQGSHVLPSLLIGGGAAAGAGGAVFYYYGQKRGANEKYLYTDTRALGVALLAIGSAAIVTGAIVWHGRRSTPVAAIISGGGYLGWAGAF